MRAVLRRLVQLIVVVVVVTFFASLLLSLLPGDPVTTMAPFANDEQREAIIEANGLDENILVRYKDWATGFFTGDMGETYVPGVNLRGTPVSDLVTRSLPRSLLLMAYVQILTLIIAVPLGVYTAYRAGTRRDRWSNGAAFALLAIPAFVLAAILKLYVGVNNDWLPTTGWVDLFDSPEEHFRHIALPVIVLAVGQVAIYARLLRTDMIATLQEDYILMAKSKGIPNRRILWRHALRPSSLTLLTVAGLNVGTLVSGALIVERIFNMGGLGSEIFQAIQSRQYVSLQSFVAIVAIVYVVVNVFVDVLYSVLDPRIRSARV